MDQQQVLDQFREAEALLEGHFILSSGLHSPVFLQCARVMMDPARGELLCAALAKKVKEAIDQDIDVVVSPAMGGVIVGYEVGRQLGIETMFVERVDGTFTFRRGFGLKPGAKVLMVEDVVTTGLSSKECIREIIAAGGNVVAGASLIDRSNGTADIGVPLVSLAMIDAPSYDADNLPSELASTPGVKPGSRNLK
jgi:orotate phosphoribosyltransferase